MQLWNTINNCIDIIFYKTKIFSVCRTSQTDAGYRNKGRLNETCVFPFTLEGTTYYSCTYDFNFVTGHKPWCSTKTDENDEHILEHWGVCDDNDNCNIPPRCMYKLSFQRCIQIHFKTE